MISPKLLAVFTLKNFSSFLKSIHLPRMISNPTPKFLNKENENL